jgi:hypothetical protein
MVQVVGEGQAMVFLKKWAISFVFSLLFIPPLCAEMMMAELSAPTLRAFEAYIKKREAGLELRGRQSNFLWCQERAERREAAREKGIVIEPFEGSALHEVEGGLIHDWVGATFIPGVSLKQVIDLIQNYDNHQNVYKPEVLRSRLLWREGNFFKVSLRLKKSKIITVVLDTEYDVTYQPLNAVRVKSKSYSTKILEIANVGTKNEAPLPAGSDHGFLWRLYTYWRFAEQDGGVYMECEAISLTRAIPTLLGPIVRPFVKEIPLESLRSTLHGTRLAMIKPAIARQ